ncbi:nitric oxide reductase activation protein NorD [Ancylobacter defluvii]|uniref:VWFA domain-containing protein n=1 Tax=Ancylobacter defluvii TaxID=1282440 RepID=A0A9W6NAD8_9HYPH|nr:VWA domain-containing protein [Ancylobacter defluvii]MBS7590445.1 VWA domain-containing protein [Ancylobacter defluvii]GLK83366.1 hypothetical protein GCM10017653_14350 [Ancylobacter defluvii]
MTAALRRDPDPDASAALERLLSRRPALHAGFLAAQAQARRHLGAAGLPHWAALVGALYHANAGPAVLEALWGIERRILPGAGLDTEATLWQATRTLCRHAGSRTTLAILGPLAARLSYGGDGRELAARLAALAGLAERAPDALAPLAAVLAQVMQELPPEPMAQWLADGLALHATDRRRRAAYFGLEDPLARRRLADLAGAVRFAPHEERLKLVTQALFGLAPEVRVIADPALIRPRLAGGLLLMPQGFPDLRAEDAAAFFEAAVTHAACHGAFTRARFTVGRMKPVQIALVSLLEDARVERLAARAYPGLGRLWRRFHTAEAASARTVASLFARLARALADPDFRDEDGWIAKARALFERAFTEDAGRQGFVPEIARILGHDLGQLRIPFDTKAYRVEPAYRDDGLGLFDWDETDPDNDDVLELVVEAARLRQEEADAAPPDSAPAPAGGARMKGAVPQEESTIAGLYPEWDHRLRTELADHVTVRLHAPAAVGASALKARLDAAGSIAARLDALMRRARLDRPTRLRRRLDGEEIDLEAAQEAMLARRLGELPDPRIHALKRRQGRDVALMLLLDVSQSTADPVGRDGESVLSTAALAVGLLGAALDGVGDPFAALAFASNGREDVRITELKRFAERWEAALPRLAGLRPAYSTRLGAAIRHGAAGLAAQATHRRVLVVVTDGEPSDIDVEDEAYLAEDARRAVADARGQGLDVFCVALGAVADRAAAAIFGRRNSFPITRVEELPARLAALYFQLTVR